MGEISKECVSRVNRVQDYIEKHMDIELTLERLASKAYFSEYYFHRLYKLVTGESLYSYIKRLRLEMAAFKLTSGSKESITDIGLSVGFSNSSSFAKAFKSAYNLSPSAYKKGKNGQVNALPVEYTETMEFERYVDQIKSYQPPLSITIKDIKPKRLVYTRYQGPYKGDANLFQTLFTKLYQWVREKGLISTDAQAYEANWLTLYHDLGGSMTSEDYQRLSVCLEVDEMPPQVDGDIGQYVLEGGLYVIARYEVLTEDYQKAWDHMFIHWLVASDYHHDSRYPFEAYPPQIKPSKEGYRVVDICIPIAPNRR